MGAMGVAVRDELENETRDFVLTNGNRTGHEFSASWAVILRA